MKTLLLAFLILFCCRLTPVSALDAWIRTNQMGFHPQDTKQAILLSENPLQLIFFTVHDALTGKRIKQLTTVKSLGAFEQFKAIYQLDISSITKHGAYFIKADYVYSDVFHIHKNTYQGTASHVSNYLRTIRKTGLETDSTGIPIRAGVWQHDQSGHQDASILAMKTFQLLKNYISFPEFYEDRYNVAGLMIPNGIPDILDEAKWGLGWLLQQYPDSTTLFHYTINNIAFPATGKAQALHGWMNNSTGIASVAGKFAAAFALGADVFFHSDRDFSGTLQQKAIEAYQLGKKHPGVSQGIPNEHGKFREEQNWIDDLLLAAMQLYYLTFERKYIEDALQWAFASPVPEWIYAHKEHLLQWYPYMNPAYTMLAAMEAPEIRNNFTHNIYNILQRAAITASHNPFNIGVSMGEYSNAKVLALRNLCYTYREITGDDTFYKMEIAHTDWILGCNPWGICMAPGLPSNVTALFRGAHKGEVAPESRPVFLEDDIQRFNTSWASLHQHQITTTGLYPDLIGVGALQFLLASMISEHQILHPISKNTYHTERLTRTDSDRPAITLHFVGHRHNNGLLSIIRTLRRAGIKANFYFTNQFYKNPFNAILAEHLMQQGHYVGVAINPEKLVADPYSKDSVEISRSDFIAEMRKAFKSAGVLKHNKQKMPFAAVPYLIQNDSIGKYAIDVGIQLISATPGTLAGRDYTLSSMRGDYYSSQEIVNSVISESVNNGLHGHILLFHTGADRYRKDHFYKNLPRLISVLKEAGYIFENILDAADERAP